MLYVEDTLVDGKEILITKMAITLIINFQIVELYIRDVIEKDMQKKTPRINKKYRYLDG